MANIYKYDKFSDYYRIINLFILNLDKFIKKNIKKLVDIISVMSETIEKKLTSKERELLFLETTLDQLKDEEREIIRIITIKILEGYFPLAVRGHQFTDSYKIKQEFGKTLEENYPEANQLFIKFAKTFWTLKICLLDSISEKSTGYIAYALLSFLENRVSGIFFPMPGIVTISSKERENTQRDILKDFDIDIEEFMKGNSILIRDKKAGI